MTQLQAAPLALRQRMSVNLATGCYLQDRSKMYSVGSFFYAIYFFVSFPMFYMLDEDARRKSTIWDAAKDSLAASMAVTILLDIWRVVFGPIVDLPVGHTGLPWLP